MFVVGIILVFLLMSAVSLLSSRRVSNASDFDSASGKASSPVVAGAIIGTLVGGSSTVGTAQLAYHYVLSAWWFTLGGGIACLILGVLCTQSYAQAVFAGKTDQEARKGALISDCLIPPIGIGGILVGLYMRSYAPQLQSAKLAFSQFIMEHLSPLLAGVVMATLLIIIVGTGAGLSLESAAWYIMMLQRSFCGKRPIRRGSWCFCG